jgi:hypothetical protein
MSSTSYFFDPLPLINDTEEKVQQMTNWVIGKGNSIKVISVPTELLEEDIKSVFSFIGDISKIVFDTDNGNRSARIYFTEWANTLSSYLNRNTIASSYPRTHSIYVPCGKTQKKLQMTMNLESSQIDRIVNDPLDYSINKMLADLDDRITKQEKQIYEIRKMITEIMEPSNSDDDYPDIYPEEGIEYPDKKDFERENFMTMKHLKFGGLRHMY